MNRYALRLKDLLWALGKFECVKIVEDLYNDEFGYNRELVFAHDVVYSIENAEEYKFLRENDYSVVCVNAICQGKKRKHFRDYNKNISKGVC